MLGPADIEAWREDAEAAAAARNDPPRRPADLRPPRRSPFLFPLTLGDMLAWRDRMFGHRP